MNTKIKMYILYIICMIQTFTIAMDMNSIGMFFIIALALTIAVFAVPDKKVDD